MSWEFCQPYTTIMHCYTVDCGRYPIPENGRMPHQNQTHVFGGGGNILLQIHVSRLTFLGLQGKLIIVFTCLVGNLFMREYTGMGLA